MDFDSSSTPKSNHEKKSKNYQKEVEKAESKPKCPDGTFPRKSTGECKSDVVMPSTLKEAYNIKDNTGFVQASQGKNMRKSLYTFRSWIFFNFFLFL